MWLFFVGLGPGQAWPGLGPLGLAHGGVSGWYFMDSHAFFEDLGPNPRKVNKYSMSGEALQESGLQKN